MFVFVFVYLFHLSESVLFCCNVFGVDNNTYLSTPISVSFLLLLDCNEYAFLFDFLCSCLSAYFSFHIFFNAFLVLWVVAGFDLSCSLRSFECFLFIINA